MDLINALRHQRPQVQPSGDGQSMAAIYTISFPIVSNSRILPAQPLDSSKRLPLTNLRPDGVPS